LACEGLVQQRLVQRMKRSELLLVNGFKVFDVFTQVFERGNDRTLLGK
jgi:hypothetical protein